MTLAVGFVGLGRIGKPIAANILAAGFDLMVFDVREEPMRDLARLGAKQARGLRDLRDHSEIVCVAVNDAMVLAAWGRERDATGKIRMLSDGLCEFTRALGLEQDLSERGLGMRSKRYAMLIVDGKVADLHVEPSGAYGVSSGEAVLERLGA